MTLACPPKLDSAADVEIADRVADDERVRSETDREDAGHPKLTHGDKFPLRYQSRSASRASQVMVTSSGSVIAIAVGLWDRKRVSVET